VRACTRVYVYICIDISTLYIYMGGWEMCAHVRVCMRDRIGSAEA
jgi:hypothetical protein